MLDNSPETEAIMGELWVYAGFWDVLREIRGYAGDEGGFITLTEYSIPQSSFRQRLVRTHMHLGSLN